MVEYLRNLMLMDVGKNLKWLCLCLFLVVLLPAIAAAADGTEGNDLHEASIMCRTNLTNILPPPYNNMSNLVCKRIWNSYVIRYSQTKDRILTIILSAFYTSGWVGIGFSKDGLMVGSSAMVGWVNTHGIPRIKQYYIQGMTPDDVIPNKGELQLTNIPEAVVLNDGTIYLAFQIKLDQPLAQQNILLAFGTKYPSRGFHLSRHDDQTSLKMDFSSGLNVVKQIPSRQQRRRHGLLGIMGWGVFLPVGAIIARYLKHKDPLWFYLHIFLQFLGFLLILANLVTGLITYWAKDATQRSHKVLGIFAFGLACQQVMAFFVRPGKESKNRKYWNWYHHWTGWLALFFGAVNIMLGIQIAAESVEWKIGYGFLLGATLMAVAILEALAMLQRKEDKASQPPAFRMNSIE